jgi:hypothetical protein
MDPRAGQDSRLFYEFHFNIIFHGTWHGVFACEISKKNFQIISFVRDDIDHNPDGF